MFCMGKNNIIGDISKFCLLQENEYYNDEPLFYGFNAIVKKSSIKTIHGTGFSYNKSDAILRALGEAIERYSLIPRDRNEVKYFRKNLLPQNRMELSNLSILSDKKQFETVDPYPLGWIKSRKIVDNNPKNYEEIFIPAQLVFVPYHYKESEPLIQQPISTGAVFHRNIDNALITGILEVLERDAFVTSYYTHNGRYKLNLDKITDKDLTSILNELRRNLLEIHLFDISNITNVHIILCLIFDKTNTQPLIVSGLGTKFNLKLAIIKSIDEALQLRPWLRDEFMNNNIHITSAKNIHDYLERVAYWNLNMSIKKIKDRLAFYFELDEKKVQDGDLKSNQSLTTKDKIKYLLSLSKKENLDIYYIDITPDFIKDAYIVIKVIIPQSQPFFLNEKYSFISRSRVGVNKKIYSKIPHFFL